MTTEDYPTPRTLVFPEVEDLGAVVQDLRARVEALEAAQPNYPAKPDSSSASASSLVDRLASVGVSRFYVKAAIREVAAWLRDRYPYSPDAGAFAFSLEQEASNA